MQENKNSLYNPTYVKATPEYFPGFGKKELHITLLMCGFIIIFAGILWLIYRDMAVVVLTLLIGCTSCVILNTKNEANLSIVTFLLLALNFMKEQQCFIYKYMDEWRN